MDTKNVLIAESLDDFLLIHKGGSEKKISSEVALLDDYLFMAKWNQLTRPKNKQFFVFIEYDSAVQSAYFSCETVDLTRMIVDKKGIMEFKKSEKLPQYVRAMLYQGFHNISEELLRVSLDALLYRKVDIILFYVFEQEFSAITSFLQDNKYNYWAQSNDQVLSNEIGLMPFDRMRLFLPEVWEDAFLPFSKKKKHHYNIRNLKRIMRNTQGKYHVTYETITPESKLTEQEIKKIIEAVSYVYQKSWQYEVNLETDKVRGYGYSHQERLLFLLQQKRLMLVIVRADSIPAAYFYGYTLNTGIQQAWMAYNKQFAKDSFGSITIAKFIELCINEKVEYIEMGGTTHQYKQDLANQKKAICEVAVFNPESQVSRQLKVMKRCYPKALI